MKSVWLHAQADTFPYDPCQTGRLLCCPPVNEGFYPDIFWTWHQDGPQSFPLWLPWNKPFFTSGTKDSFHGLHSGCQVVKYKYCFLWKFRQNGRNLLALSGKCWINSPLCFTTKKIGTTGLIIQFLLSLNPHETTGVSRLTQHCKQSSGLRLWNWCNIKATQKSSLAVTVCPLGKKLWHISNTFWPPF